MRVKNLPLRALALATGCAALLSVGIAAGPADARAASRVPAYAITGHTRTVAPGIAFTAQSWSTADGSTENSSLLTVDLGNTRVSLGSFVQGGALASAYAALHTVLGRSPGADVAAVNASFFSLDDLRQPPAGGVAMGGVVLKSPKAGALDNFYVRADGSAGIGAVTYVGGARVLSRSGSSAARTVLAVNTPANPGNNSLTLVTPAIAYEFAPAGCAVSTFAAVKTKTGEGQLVATTTVASHRHRSPQPIARVGSGRFALLGCGSGASWLHGLSARTRLDTWGYLAEGTSRTARQPIAARRIRTLVAGAEQILRGGRTVHDTTDHHIEGANAETFACVARDSRHVLLGAVAQTSDWADWDSHDYSDGVTMSQLRAYAARLGCYDAVALDGGGSTTIDYRPRGSATVLQGVEPTYEQERELNNGLIIGYR